MVSSRPTSSFFAAALFVECLALLTANPASAVVVRTTTSFPPPNGFGFVLDGAIFPDSPYISRLVSEVRIDWTVVVNDGFDAAQIDASYLSPVLLDYPNSNQRVAFDMDGFVEGWSGAGTFNYSRTVSPPNMAFGPVWTFWTHQALGLPRDEVSVQAGSRVEIDYLADEGDYNDDGIVDLADYTVWRNNLGATGLDAYAPGDGTGDGSVNVADYNLWRSQYGSTTRLVPNSKLVTTPVPEPMSVLLLGGMCALLASKFVQCGAARKPN